MDDGLGDVQEVLMVQEEKLARMSEENKTLGAAVEALQAKLKNAEAQQNSALRRAADAEAKLLAQQRGRAAAASGGGAGGDSQQLKEELERLKRKVSNDRILLEQADRHRRDAERQLAAARQGDSRELAAAQQQAAALQQENGELRQQLAAAQRQLRQLDSLQSFADVHQEQQQREAQLAAALAAATDRVHQLEGRCTSLEAELEVAASALQAAAALQPEAGDGSPCSSAAALPHQQRGRSRRQLPVPHNRETEERGEDSLSLSDLCNLEGCSSPEHSPGAATSDGSGALPSRQHALARRRQAQQQERQQADAEAAQASLVASLQQQLQEQQRQLSALEQQQRQLALQGCSTNQQQQQQEHWQQREQQQLQQECHVEGRGAGETGAVQQQQQQLEAQVDKLKRRNTQLQTALAEASLQHARAATLAQKQLAAAQQDAAQLRQQWEEARQQLAQLQAAVDALRAFTDGKCGGSDAVGCGSSDERLAALHAELLEYATRCNIAVEQNAVLLQEKKQWLEKLRAAEAETERCRAEAQQLRLHHLHLNATTGSSSSTEVQLQREEQLLQRLLEAQAAEAALRSVLCEAREEQVAACKALSGELRRVHALERLRISDVQEVQRLQRHLHDLQRECQQLAKALVAAQQRQPLMALGKQNQQLEMWAAP